MPDPEVVDDDEGGGVGKPTYYHYFAAGATLQRGLHLAGRTVPLQPMVACIVRFFPHDCGV